MAYRHSKSVLFLLEQQNSRNLGQTYPRSSPRVQWYTGPSVLQSDGQ